VFCTIGRISSIAVKERIRVALVTPLQEKSPRIYRFLRLKKPDRRSPAAPSNGSERSLISRVLRDIRASRMLEIHDETRYQPDSDLLTCRHVA